MLPSFNLSSFHLFAIALVIVEALTDSVMDSVAYIIAYPMYYHLPVGGGVITYIGAYFIPSKRVYRFIVILYIPVLCLWKAGRKVLVSPKRPRSDVISDSDLDLCLTSPLSSDTEDDARKVDVGSRRKRARRNSERRITPRIRGTFQKVLPVGYGGQVCWRAASQVCQQVRWCTRRAVVPLAHVYGIGALKDGLSIAWQLVPWGWPHSKSITPVEEQEVGENRWVHESAEGILALTDDDEEEEEDEEEDRWVKERAESILAMSDAEGGLHGLCRSGEDVCTDLSLLSALRSTDKLRSRSISYGELVHFNDEKYQSVLKQYKKRWSLYRKMPLKSASRLWGRLCQINLPVWLRAPVLSLYIWLFGCSLDEAALRDLRLYRNLSEFFRRRLRPGVRPINKHFDLTSPADGKILYCGPVNGSSLEQVKGVTYSLKGFLGPLDSLLQFTPEYKDYAKRPTFTIGSCSPDILTEIASVPNFCLAPNDILEMKTRCLKSLVEREDEMEVDAEESLDESGYLERLLINPKNRMYQCIIYLAPGDYHRFHSPADWTVYARRHFPGELFSVNPGIARWLQGLFNFNERAVYVGHWKHGFFSMTAVGATNVGSINVDFDPELVTNTSSTWENGCFHDASFSSSSKKKNIAGGVRSKKGQAFGDFNLGSTIVLLFEASVDFKFSARPGQTVKYGQALGLCSRRKPASKLNGKHHNRR